MRAWADNEFDTDVYEQLLVKILDPCLSIQTPDESTLEAQTYRIGSGLQEFYVQDIAPFRAPAEICGAIKFEAKLFDQSQRRLQTN